MNIRKVICLFLIILLIIVLFFILRKEKINNDIKRGETKKIENNKNDKIPKIVFKTSPNDLDNLNSDIIFLFNKIIKDNPDFKIEYYDDNDARDFLKNNYDMDVLMAYDKLKPGAYKADLFRYCVLYKRGGIYSDISQMFKVPFDEIINFEEDNLVLVEDRPQVNFTGPEKWKKYDKAIQISFMATRPNNSIYLDSIKEIVKNCKENFYGWNPLSPTGPQLFYRMLEKYDGDYKVDIYMKNSNELSLKKDDKTVIFCRSKNHYKKNLNNNLHYSVLWKMNNIYNF